MASFTFTGVSALMLKKLISVFLFLTLFMSFAASAVPVAQFNAVIDVGLVSKPVIIPVLVRDAQPDKLAELSIASAIEIDPELKKLSSYCGTAELESKVRAAVKLKSTSSVWGRLISDQLDKCYQAQQLCEVVTPENCQNPNSIASNARQLCVTHANEQKNQVLQNPTARDLTIRDRCSVMAKELSASCLKGSFVDAGAVGIPNSALAEKSCRDNLGGMPTIDAKGRARCKKIAGQNVPPIITSDNPTDGAGLDPLGLPPTNLDPTFPTEPQDNQGDLGLGGDNQNNGFDPLAPDQAADQADQTTRTTPDAPTNRNANPAQQAASSQGSQCASGQLLQQSVDPQTGATIRQCVSVQAASAQACPSGQIKVNNVCTTTASSVAISSTAVNAVTNAAAATATSANTIGKTATGVQSPVTNASNIQTAIKPTTSTTSSIVPAIPIAIVPKLNTTTSTTTTAPKPVAVVPIPGAVVAAPAAPTCKSQSELCTALHCASTAPCTVSATKDANGCAQYTCKSIGSSIASSTSVSVNVSKTVAPITIKIVAIPSMLSAFATADSDSSNSTSTSDRATNAPVDPAKCNEEKLTQECVDALLPAVISSYSDEKIAGMCNQQVDYNLGLWKSMCKNPDTASQECQDIVSTSCGSAQPATEKLAEITRDEDALFNVVLKAVSARCTTAGSSNSGSLKSISDSAPEQSAIINSVETVIATTSGEIDKTTATRDPVYEVQKFVCLKKQEELHRADQCSGQVIELQKAIDVLQNTALPESAKRAVDTVVLPNLQAKLDNAKANCASLQKGSSGLCSGFGG